MNINKKKNLNVMLADFSYYNRYTTYSRIVPLGIGFIGQYAKQKFGDDIKVSLYKNVDKFFEDADSSPPDVVGLALYYWANSLNQIVVKELRKKFGNKLKIIIGGPSIDSDINQQKIFLTKLFPEVDAIAINEGEIAFSNVLEKILGNNNNNIFSDPIDGLSFLKEHEVISGKPIGTTMDISKLGSPYLSGLLDDFIKSDYQPMIQTSRFCPYTCAFCVSGKNRGKLRGFPMEQVKEELKFISKNWVNRKNHILRLADENFGILKRDVEIAQEIRECKERFGYPEKVFFYNDKRFTEVSRKVVEIIGDMCQFGLTLALQTENPETLKAINRKNVTNDEIDDAIKWASNINMPTTTELIFGLPYETRNSFVDLMNKSIKRGFDSILCNMLFIMDGIELNRQNQRDKFKLKTKFRPLSTNYGKIRGTFAAEYEEVVVETDSFNQKDFFEIRSLNFMFFTVFTLGFQKWFFQYVKNGNKNIELTELLSKFMNPDLSEEWPKEYLEFLNDFNKSIRDELFDTKEEMYNYMKKIYEDNNNEVVEPTRLNINFAARLIYQEKSWVDKVLQKHFENLDKDNDVKSREIAKSFIKLGSLERINLKDQSENKELELTYDILNWQKGKFKQKLIDFKIPPKKIKFLLDNSRKNQISALQKNYEKLSDKDFYITALDFVSPRTHLMHKLEFKEN